jgi:hypothetical protein
MPSWNWTAIAVAEDGATVGVVTEGQSLTEGRTLSCWAFGAEAGVFRSPHSGPTDVAALAVTSGLHAVGVAFDAANPANPQYAVLMRATETLRLDDIADGRFVFADAIDRFFKLGNNLNQRDTIAVRKTVSGLLKLLFPHGAFEKDDVRQCLEYALETRRRVKEQLKKIGGMEFYDVHFSYIDQDTHEERFISVPEQGGGHLIPDGPMKPGVLHTIGVGSGGHLGLYRLETQTTAGNGKFAVSGISSSSAAREALKIGFDYFKANVSRISGSSKAGDHDYHVHEGVLPV